MKKEKEAVASPNVAARFYIFIGLFAAGALVVLAIVRAGNVPVDIGASITSGKLQVSGPIQKCNDDFILFGSNFDASCDGTPSTNPNEGLNQFRNTEPTYFDYQNTQSNSIPVSALTITPDRPDNGDGQGQGQFRTNCHYSHLLYDDPIFFPGEPGKAHLHMFFGNTELDADAFGDEVTRHGGGSCDGGALNRTGYWTPTLHDAQGRVRIPDRVIAYYKTRSPSTAQRFPQGLEIVAGEHLGIGNSHWACGENGSHSGSYQTIPNCNGVTLHGGIKFPQCWDGRNLRSSDHISHMRFINESNDGTSRCPSSHPVLLPQIEILMYWRNTGSTNGWYLSSDRHNGANSPNGSTLHADWLGGWNDEVMDLWTDNCIKKGRNCSGGQTGTYKQLRPVKNGNQLPEQYRIITLP